MSSQKLEYSTCKTFVKLVERYPDAFIFVIVFICVNYIFVLVNTDSTLLKFKAWGNGLQNCLLLLLK